MVNNKWSTIIVQPFASIESNYFHRSNKGMINDRRRMWRVMALGGHEPLACSRKWEDHEKLSI